MKMQNRFSAPLWNKKLLAVQRGLRKTIIEAAVLELLVWIAQGHPPVMFWSLFIPLYTLVYVTVNLLF